MKKRPAVLLPLLGVLVLSSAVFANAPLPTVGSNVCVISDPEKLTGCTEGDVVSYQPKMWGNEQMPTRFISFACDLTKPVFMTEAGVVCVYTQKNTLYDGDEKFDKKAKAPKPDPWQEFLDKTVKAEGSGWVQVSDTMYKKVLQEGGGAKLAAPVKFTVSYQALDAQGNKTGAPFNSDYDVKQGTASTFLDHRDGAVLDLLWLNKEDISKTRRFQGTIKIKP
jgi:hypothetical protein